MEDHHDVDITAMSRVLVLLQSPVAKTYMGLYLGKTDVNNMARSDFEGLWDGCTSPSMLFTMAMGGKEVCSMLAKGLKEFDLYFGYPKNDYQFDDMVCALEALEKKTKAENDMKEMIVVVMKETKCPTTVSFVKKHKSILLGGTMSGIMILVFFLYFFVIRPKTRSTDNNGDQTIHGRKRKCPGE